MEKCVCKARCPAMPQCERWVGLFCICWIAFAQAATSSTGACRPAPAVSSTQGMPDPGSADTMHGLAWCMASSSTMPNASVRSREARQNTSQLWSRLFFCPSSTLPSNRTLACLPAAVSASIKACSSLRSSPSPTINSSTPLRLMAALISVSNPL